MLTCLSDFRVFTALFAVFATMAHTATADTQRGRTVAENLDMSYSGYGTSVANGKMTLFVGGRKAVRSFRSLSLETKGAIDEMSILVFSEPKDMRGVALLTHARTEPREDLQWLYIPAGSRTKRITSSNKSGRFVSSEFSFEDLARQDVDEFTYAWLRQESCPSVSLTCDVIEAYPKSRNSGYSKRVIWVDTKAHRAYQIDYFNQSGVHEKRLELSTYERPMGVKWRPMKMDMRNLLNNRRTVLEWSQYKFSVPLQPAFFDSNRLAEAAQ